MVMFSTWQRTALDPRIASDLPMNGESTDLGASAPDPAGYLGKVNERASLVENCPWCSAKGHIYSLRSYRMNFHESITLCTNPECLFPLVSKPLEEILNSLIPVDCKDGGKRQSPSREDAVVFSKRHKAESPEAGTGLRSDMGLGHSRGAAQEAVSLDVNGEHIETVCSDSVHCIDPDPRDFPSEPSGGNLRRSALPLQDGLLGEDSGGPEVDCSELQPLDPLRDTDKVGLETQDRVLFVSDGVFPVVEEVRPTVEHVGLPKEHVLISTNTEQEVRSMAGPEVSLPVAQAEWVTEVVDELPIVVQKGRLTEELKVGPMVEEKVRPMAKPETRLIVEPVTIPMQQAADLTDELKIGSTVEVVVRPTVVREDRSVGMVPVPSHLFWRNESNLCWLDALLVALVHCRTLRKHADGLLKNKSPIQQLCKRYSKACDFLKTKEQICHEDKISKVPSTVLDQTLNELEDLRMSAFKLLQPKLKCSLGKYETPVFALPVLLKLDSEVEALFQHTFHWDFECALCGHTSRNRGQKTLSTFPGVLPNWHPLQAVHQAKCNQCQRSLQTRKMVLKSIPPVFALHFVEGLPQNDVDTYSFDFHDNHYFVSTVIQYDEHLKHFATWIRDDSGSWLEFDDLKYPQCTSHKSLPVPASQIHMAFWEVQAAKLEGVCPGGRYQNCTPADTGTGVADGHQRDLSLAIPQDDTYIVEALTEDSAASPNGPDSSVGSTTLLEAFEGLSHSDIVTLTLVEVKVDADGRTLADSGPTVTVDSSPVLSSRANDGTGHSAPKQQRDKKGSKTAPRGRKVAQPDNGAISSPTPKSPPPMPKSPPTSESSLSAPDSPSPINKAPTPSSFPTAQWSTLLSRHPSFQTTPFPPKRGYTVPSYKPPPKLTNDSGLPEKAAEMFRGFQARAVVRATNGVPDGDHCQSDDPSTKTWLKSPCPQPAASNAGPPSLKPPRRSEGLPQNTLIRPAKDLKTLTSALNDTSALRRKLLKKLKKKKKLLAALDNIMGKEAANSLARPDSTEIGSPYTVSSTTSQCSSSGYNEFLNDLLSPATTASNLSPDSTGLLEMLVNGQESVEAADKNPATTKPAGGGVDWHVPVPAGNNVTAAKDDFLEEFMSGTGLQPSQTENVDFNMFDMFF